jgi:hypothetical protein
VKTTRLGRHTQIAVWYSRGEGGIVVPLRAGIEALDALYCDAPGTRFVFGVEVGDKTQRPFFTDILQWGNGDWLFATV